jgi:microcystin-dependent protein
MQGTIGEIKIFAGNFAPQSWKFCHGQVLNIADYPAAYNVLGTAYGGDGETTFQLPDCRGRVLIGAGQGAGLSNRAFATAGGAETVTLTTEQMPVHNHNAAASVTGTVSPFCISTNGDTDSPEGNWPAVALDTNNAAVRAYSTASPDAQMKATPINATASVSTSNAGGGESVVLTNPYTVVNYIICVEAFMPS